MNDFNLNKMRCRKLAWMKDEWKWHIIFTDACSILCPKYARVQTFGYISPVDTWIKTFKGSNDEPNGPN